MLWVPRLTNGFAMYYTYARLVLDGQTLDRVYDETYFNAKVHEFGFDLQDQPNNPPTGALAYLPVAWLGPSAARILWGMISLAALAFALKLLFEISGIRPSGSVGLGLLTLVFLWHPAWDTVALGQLYFVLLLLFMLSMKSFAAGRRAGTGVFLASAFLVKGYGVVPALLLALRRRWKEFAVSVAAVFTVVTVTLPLLGWRSWPEFYSVVLTSLGTLPPDAHVAYQTLNGLIRHLFTYDPRWLPHPLAVLPGFVVTVLSLGINSAVVISVLLRSRLESREEKCLSFAAAVAAGVVTAPLAEEYHYVLFLPLVFALAAIHTDSASAGGRKWTSGLLPLVAALIIAAPLNSKVLQDAYFPLVLLAYPKLYAGLALLAEYWKEMGELRFHGRQE